MIRNYVFLTMVFALMGCSVFEEADKKTLEGERLSLYDFEKTLRSDPNTQFGMDGTEEQSTITLPESLKGGVDKTISLDAPWDNKFWPQVGGYPNHAMKHVAFTEGQPRRIWTRSIGRGTNKTTPLTAAPIVADNMVFTLDTSARVQATNAQNGQVLWTRNILKQSEDEPVIGGGLAYSGDQVFVTNGFNELLSLNPKNGAILWRVETQSPIRGAPSAVPGRVFVVTMDNKTQAYNAENGIMVWQHSGLRGNTSILGASTPAIDKNAVVTAYSSGEIFALRIENGQELWSHSLAPIARVAGRMQMTDIRALPIITDGSIFAASSSNRVASIDMRTGLPQWNAAIGSLSTPWVSGNRIYMIGLQGVIISLDRASGKLLWQSNLPRFEDMDDREGLITWQGPLLAGNRLFAFASTGDVREINPTDGSLIRDWDAGSGIKLSPAVAGGVLYIIDDNGTLSAWR